MRSSDTMYVAEEVEAFYYEKINPGAGCTQTPKQTNKQSPRPGRAGARPGCDTKIDPGQAAPGPPGLKVRHNLHHEGGTQTVPEYRNGSAAQPLEAWRAKRDT